ncbi:MAG: hypothetical protein JKP95_01505 [Oceanicaulis sp.]|nr:hypothetical protein [Oceanicaulis sp.]
MLVGGGIDISVDGEPFVAPEHVTYRGMMLSGVPNAALAFGYTNASWTLKVDLTAERVCRLINHMKARNLDYVVPVPPADLETLPLLDFSSGYVQRALPTLPRQGRRRRGGPIRIISRTCWRSALASWRTAMCALEPRRSGV